MIDKHLKDLDNLEWYMKYYIDCIALKYNFEPTVEFDIHGECQRTSQTFKTFRKFSGFKKLWFDLYIDTFEDFVNKDISATLGSENYPYKSRMHEWQCKFPN